MAAAQFHPMMLNDDLHEQFIEEVGNKTPNGHGEEGLEDVGDFNQENLDIGSHMDYCSSQLRKIEMNDSDGEEDILMPEMVCLPEEMEVGIGSAKRSLLESLDMVEMEKKRKSESNKMKK
ncbi:hypothetical protein D1007_12673 [Hordeum vulgare]|nr:hypothetical protein D1007_12673 [Hordeum vulgare]